MVSYIKYVLLIMASLNAKLSEPLSGPGVSQQRLTCQNQEATMGDVACLPLARQLSFTPMSEDEVVRLMPIIR